MRILVLEPFYGGSHRRFLDRWQELSRHELTLWTLPARHWKWRMRHAALEFARRLDAEGRSSDVLTWDVLVCSDMLNLAELRGLAPALASLPTAIYFHENQLTYPVQKEEERDRHFAFSNLLSAHAADAVWWNSTFHQGEFLSAARDWLRRLPDYRPLFAVDGIAAKSAVLPQGIDLPALRCEPRRPGPLRILWAARWEFDKNPEAFFAALGRLREQGVDFRLAVLGERYRRSPEIFDRARREFHEHIDQWGFLSRADYEAVLRDSDVFVSTADHEFFGVAAAEAVAAGCYPLLPDRLAYPELLQDLEPSAPHLYGGSGAGTEDPSEELAGRLGALAQTVEQGTGPWRDFGQSGRQAMARYDWPRVAEALDAACESLAVAFGGAAR